jgi:hypothetical protein
MQNILFVNKCVEFCWKFKIVECAVWLQKRLGCSQLQLSLVICNLKELNKCFRLQKRLECSQRQLKFKIVHFNRFGKDVFGLSDLLSQAPIFMASYFVSFSA